MADDDQSRRIEFGGEFWAGVSVNLDQGVPGAANSCQEKPLPLHADQSDVPSSLIEELSEFSIDPLIIANIRHIDDG